MKTMRLKPTLSAAAVILWLALADFPLHAAENPNNKPASTPAPATTEALDEISDSAGKITKLKVLGIGEKEILVKDPVTGEEKKLSTDNLIFARTASGKYYFFFQQEQAPAANTAAKSTASAPATWELSAGLAGHLANNDTTAAYTGDLASSLVTRYNQTVGSGFTANGSGTTPRLAAQIFLEPRLNFENFILGLSLGYAGLPKTSAVVSSAGASVQSTINVNGMFFPVTFIFYYKLISDGPLGLNLGFGAGALYTAVRVNIVGGDAENEQVLTSLNPMLVFKPELTYRFGAIRLLFSIPVYWAEARDVTDGDETLLRLNTRNIVSPNLSGVGFMLAAGINL